MVHHCQCLWEATKQTAENNEHVPKTMVFIIWRQIASKVANRHDFLFQGITYSIPGPHLLAFACNVHTTLDKIGLLFVSRAIGILLGTFASNKIINKLKGYGVICLALLAMSILLSLFSNVTNLAGAVGVMFAIGAAYGVAAEGNRLS